MQKQRNIDIKDSNLANYGSKMHKDATHAAAETEEMWKGAGSKPGLEIWRVENKRTENDTPDFGVNRWPKKDYGKFYSGDSYIVLNTYKKIDPLTKKLTNELGWDVHFWIGKESSQDEYGVAAYKTVELDDLLHDGPIQHRETQGNESQLFLSYFKKAEYGNGIMIMKGGIESGFRHVEADKYTPRLFEVFRSNNVVRATEVKLSADSMCEDDCYVLDAGTKIYTYIGKTSDAFEKSKTANLAGSLAAGRNGKSKVVAIDDEFWKVLGGKKNIAAKRSGERPVAATDKPMNSDNLVLFRLSDSSGTVKFTKEKEGKLNHNMLDSNDVFIIDTHIQIFIWTGKNASKTEKSQSMKYAMQYLRDHKLPGTTPVSVVNDGQINYALGELLGGTSGVTHGVPKVANAGSFCVIV